MARRQQAPVEVRPARPADADAMAGLHARLLPHGFFAELGRGFLRSYHRTFMGSPHAVSLVACRDGRVVGLIAGAIDAGLHQRFVIRRHGLRLLVAGLAGLVRRPRVAAKFVMTRLPRYARGFLRAARPASAPAAGPAADPTRVAVLTHVAVDPDTQGSGAGAALVHAFTDAVRAARAAPRIELVTLAETGASAFYEHLGWQPAGEHRRDGVPYRRFALDLR